MEFTIKFLFVISTVLGITLWIVANSLFSYYKVKTSMKGFIIRSIIAGLCIGTFLTAMMVTFQYHQYRVDSIVPNVPERIVASIGIGIMIFLLKIVYGYLDKLTLKESVVNGLMAGMGITVFLISIDLMRSLELDLYRRLLDLSGLLFK